MPWNFPLWPGFYDLPTVLVGTTPDRRVHRIREFCNIKAVWIGGPGR
jgi:hypothetical protein